MSALLPFFVVLLLSFNMGTVQAMNNNNSSTGDEPTCPVSAPLSIQQRIFNSVCHGNETALAASLAELKQSSLQPSLQPSMILDGFGLSPLHWAGSMLNLNMVNMLLDAGFSPSQLGGRMKRLTPLHSSIRAVQAKSTVLRVEVVTAMVTKDPSATKVRNADEQTPAELAQSLNLAVLVETLAGFDRK